MKKGVLTNKTQVSTNRTKSDDEERRKLKEPKGKRREELKKIKTKENSHLFPFYSLATTAAAAASSPWQQWPKNFRIFTVHLMQEKFQLKKTLKRSKTRRSGFSEGSGGHYAYRFEKKTPKNLMDFAAERFPGAKTHGQWFQKRESLNF